MDCERGASIVVPDRDGPGGLFLLQWISLMMIKGNSKVRAQFDAHSVYGAAVHHIQRPRTGYVRETDGMCVLAILVKQWWW